MTATTKSTTDKLSSRAIDAIYLTARCKYGSDTLKEVLELLRMMEEAAYSKGASDALEKVKEYAINGAFACPHKTGKAAYGDVIDMVKDELLSQYNKQGVVEVEK